MASINFHRISFRNIMSFGNTSTEYEFSKTGEAVLIRGINGTGKSTILDALCFALFGKAYRGITKLRLVNSVNQQNMLVTLEFSIAGREYKIIRGLKPGVFEIHRDGDMIPQDAKKNDYQEMLENDILHINFKSFKQIIILGSSFVAFLKLSVAERRIVVEDILDIEILSQMKEIAKEDDKLIEDKLRKADRATAIGLSQLDILNAEKAASKKKQEISANAIKKGIDETRKEYDIVTKEISEMLGLFTSIKKDLSTKAGFLDPDALAGLETEFRSHTHIISQLNNTIDFFANNDSCPTCSQDISRELSEVVVHDSKDSINTNEKDQKLAHIKIDALRVHVADHAKSLADKDAIIRAGEKARATQKALQDKIESQEGILSLVGGGGQEEDFDEKIKKSERELRELNLVRNGLIKDQVIHGETMELLKDAGIKAAIIKTYIPMVNRLMTERLNEFSFPVSFILDETFSETIKSRHRDEFTYDSFSEGEKARINIAMLLTWRDIAKMRNSVHANILFLDEVFDSSLDYDGTDDLLRLMETLKIETNIYVISHKGDSIIDRFDRIIQIEKIGNFSKITNA